MICYEITNPDAAHTIVAVEAKAATCTENGNIAYWYCSDCGAAWADEALTQMTNQRNVIIPATGHEYFYPCDAHCMICGELTNPDAAHNIAHEAAVEATCQQTGNIEYWYCQDCGTCWADEAFIRHMVKTRQSGLPAEHTTISSVHTLLSRLTETSVEQPVSAKCLSRATSAS